jgi:putative oxidoreductase
VALCARRVHLDNGPWNTRGGYEHNLVLIAALLGIVDGGPGTPSLDRALAIHKTGPGWALAALGAGALASAATLPGQLVWRAR